MLTVYTNSARVIIYRLGPVGGFCKGSHNFGSTKCKTEQRMTKGSSRLGKLTERHYPDFIRLQVSFFGESV